MEQLSQALSDYDYVFPQTYTGAFFSIGIDMSKFKRSIWTILVGTGGGSLSGFLQSSPLANFASFSTIANSALTIPATAGTISTIEIRGDSETFQFPTGRYVRFAGTVSGSLILSVLGQGGEAIQKPAQQYNPAAVIQQIIVTP